MQLHRFLSLCLLIGPLLFSGCATVSVPIPDSGHTAKLSLYVKEKEKRGTVLILNGCDGPGKGQYTGWAHYINQLGYNAIAIDSFSSRGFTNICGTANALPYTQSASHDAKEVGRWVKQQAWSNGKVAVLGFSLGGGETLAANTTLRKMEDAVFDAAIAYYPNCEFISDHARPLAPMQVHIGTADQWTPAENCRELQKASAFKSVDFYYYEGAHHAFDGYVNGAFRCYRGPSCVVARDSKADALSRERVMQFLLKYIN